MTGDSYEAEADLRQAIHDAIESASGAVHDSTDWWSGGEYSTLEERLVNAAKCYFYRRSADVEAALKDELNAMRDRVNQLVSSMARDYQK